ncbi:hypothetical protein ACFW3D_05225 [Streptomyces sp. NPDC058864]
MRGGAARARQRRQATRETEPHPDAPDTGEAATGTAAGSWLLRGADGRLTAYAPCRDGLLRWTQTVAGGDGWTGPDVLAAPGLTHLSVAQGGDGFVHFVGRRELPCADGRVAVDVGYAVQYQTGRPLTEWVSVGNPHPEPERARCLGAPAAAVDASGVVHVFVRAADGGVMLRREGGGGKWEAWKDLRGRGVHDGLAPVVSPAGALELLAPAATSALHWIQAEAGGELRRSLDMRPAPVPGSVAALATAPDRLTYLWTDAAGSGLVAHRQGDWVVPLGGSPAADAANAVLRAVLDGQDCMVVTHRGLNGNAMVGVCRTEAEASGMWWVDTGVPCLGTPAMAADALGRVVLAVLGPDGVLRVTRQRDEPGLTLADWVRV